MNKIGNVSSFRIVDTNTGEVKLEATAGKVKMNVGEDRWAVASEERAAIRYKNIKEALKELDIDLTPDIDLMDVLNALAVRWEETKKRG